MKKAIWILCGLLVMSSLNSCKNYLDQVPDDVLTIDDIFKSKANTDKFLANIYSTVPNELRQRFVVTQNSGPWTAASDEAKYTWDFNYANNMTAGVWSRTDGTIQNFWNNYYRGIRNASYFIENIDQSNAYEVTDVMRKTYKAEARALRALYYFYLVRSFGAVPILGESYLDLNAPIAELKLPRTPFDDCITFIVSELDKAYQDLPYEPISEEYGRLTKGVAKGYKAEALLLAASPLFNGNTAYANLKNVDGTALYASVNDPNKWRLAATAAKEFIDEFVPRYYDLYKVTDANPFRAAYLSCRNVMTADWNKEWIFARSVSENNTQYDRTPKHVGFPSGAQGGGALGATQFMVDAYLMANGLPINDANSGYSEQGFSNYQAPYDVAGRTTFNMYVNREPRFYVGITYSGSYWLNQSNSSTVVLSLFNYSGNSGRSQSTSDVTPTGYTVRKNVGANGNNRGALLLRLANVYLNYAEALNEGQPGDADILKYVNLIRERAGIPVYGSANIPVPSNQEAMREAIRRERQIELAFENVRFFDTRRWKIAEQTHHGAVYGMNLSADGDNFFKRTLIENRVFNKDRDYLFPIPNTEVLRNEKMIQNPGW
ncbi:RagB/SusD family nutrient uptake outer membrane protein [Sphingobacterium psychroaquaticum]|uniref:Starch-binding associating with outer membrane n=1 Tax=Sphingobacterium psychroaquaticum TaxID=561061 RepID=A0A1X7J234_9SPHI|nr:RagB/SusD family nutrient uptake outer membrane protein [Sphingobacterium psychroaquaticum]SMG21403.1 Starch-binding associating with outer membrane [Sphingobacterium psychroaquaticum]